MQSTSDDERRGRCPATSLRPKGCDPATASAALVLLNDDLDIAFVGPPCISRRRVAMRASSSISKTL